MVVSILENKVVRSIFFCFFIALTGCSNNVGETFYQEKKYAEAIPPLLLDYAKDSTDENTLLYLAESYRQTNDFFNAVKYYKAYFRYATITVDPLVNLGDAYFKVGDTTEALETFLLALSYSPENDVALYNLGVIYFTRGMYPEAVKYLSASVEKQESAEGYWILSKALLNNKDVEMAREAVTVALSLDSTNSQYWVTRGIIAGQLNELNRAKEYFSKAILFDSLNSEAYYNRAYSLYLLHQSDSACKDLELAGRRGMIIEPELQKEICP